MRSNCRNSNQKHVPVWNTPDILSSDRDGAQASIISPSGHRCSSSQEISRRERCNFDGIRVSCLAIVEEHPRNERCSSLGRSIPLSSTKYSDPAFAMEQQSPDRMVCLWVSSSDSDSEPGPASSSRSSSFPHSTSCMVNEMRFLNGVISANSSSASWNRKPSRTNSSMDGAYASKKGVRGWCESRKSMPRNSRWRRFLSFGQVKSEGNESTPETWRPKTVFSGFCKSISNHRVESSADRRDICDR